MEKILIFGLEKKKILLKGSEKGQVVLT